MIIRYIRDSFLAIPRTETEKEKLLKAGFKWDCTLLCYETTDNEIALKLCEYLSDKARSQLNAKNLKVRAVV